MLIDQILSTGSEDVRCNECGTKDIKYGLFIEPRTIKESLVLCRRCAKDYWEEMERRVS